MNLGIVLAIFGIAIAHHLSEALFPVIVDCCTEVAHHIPRQWLRRVVKFHMQKGGDLCKIPAVILHTKHKKVCISADNRHVKRWMKQNPKGRRRTSNRVQKTKKVMKRKIVNKQWSM